MSSIKREFYLCFLLIAFLAFNLHKTESSALVDPGSIITAPFSYNYTHHLPTSISSDDDFLPFPGSGTLADPFVIEGFNITSDNPFGIHISSTTKHVLIQDCFIDVSLTGILIEDKFEGSVRIENNIIVNSKDMNGHGVVAYLCKDVVLENNIISNHASSGLLMAGVDYSYIFNNSFSFNGKTGIEVGLVNTLGVFENECNDNERKGMYVGGSDFAMIWENECSRNGEEGIYLEESESCTFLDNTIEGNRLRGMKMDGARGCLLNYNLFRDNLERGLYLDEDCENNWIYLNDFINSSIGGYSQGRDEGRGNHWYNEIEKTGNYWDEHTAREVYYIDGNAENKDLYPISLPNTLEELQTSQVKLYLLQSILLISLSRKLNRHAQYS